MSYQVLARKWRPKSFNELEGQSHVVTVLVNALTQQRLHHAYLFTGTRGVGKTTIARIFAKSLNCELGITATPCGVCDACTDIDLGNFVDLIEIDAASRTKVDDTREILDNVQYAPTRGRYKVYLIDEVHMLSRSSFNALLKTLEEPPEHVKFILATTDPQKLPITILSRCLQFHLKALTITQIEHKVKEILDNESVSYDGDAITLLAKAAQGSMRDCLSLTDQSIAQGNGNISHVNVQEMLGGVDKSWVFKIIVELLKQDANALMTLSLDIASYAPSYSQLTAELIQLLHQVAMSQVISTSFNHSIEHQALIDNFCQLMSPEDVQLYYQIVLNARKDLPYAADEQAAFDMMLLRLLAFKPVLNTQSLNATNESATIPSLDVTSTIEDSECLLEVKRIDDIESCEQQTIVEGTTETETNEEYLHNNEQPIEQEKTLNTLENEMVNIEQLSQTMTNDYSKENLSKDDDHIKTVEEVSSSAPGSFSVNEKHLEVSVVREIEPITQSTEMKPEEHSPDFSSPVAAAIATRNMLRSRKKSLEDGEKKPNDASERQTPASNVALNESVISEKIVPDLASISQEPYSSDSIDPAKVTAANQVDKWANMIDSMSLIARLRQLAIHATIDESSTDELLILQLDQSIKHLNSDAAHKQLEASLSEYLQRKITVELNIVEKTVADPYQIQADINVKRYEYAKELLNSDELVIAMRDSFQAELDQETIEAR